MNISQLPGQMDHLELAGTMLEKHDSFDISRPGLLEITGVTQHGMATTSGLNDYDYQNITNLSMGHKSLSQISTVNKVPIPPEVLEHFKHIKSHCMMGLFPEIGRAWLTIDTDIYIWTYEQAIDVAYYDGSKRLIVSVGLITPKPGVFISDVKYLLVLTTPVEIIVLGITFGDTTTTISTPTRIGQNYANYEEMQLLNKPIFVINTENVAIKTIVGSDKGRIFLGGLDGCLYEISYQAESSWFGGRCKKVNHSQGIISYVVPNFLKIFSESDTIASISIDNSRQLLYVLTEKGSIEAWNMGEDANSMKRITKIIYNEIEYTAANILRTVDSSIFKQITSICALTTDDSENLHLLAITKSGVRFYFSTVPLQIGNHMQSQQQQQQQNQLQQTQPHQGLVLKPNGLYLLHVRLPPGYTPNATMGKPKDVHKAYYKRGSFLMVSSLQQDQDTLWSISSEPFLNRPYLAESTVLQTFDGMVWDLAESKNDKKMTINSVLRNAQVPKKIIFLTNQGTHTIALLKPVDILMQLLVACNGPHHEAVKGYFQIQTEPEACAISLLLACMDDYKGTDISMWAAQAFMLYGGEPHIASPFFRGQQIPAPQRACTSSPINLMTDRGSPQMFMSTPFTGRSLPQGQQNLMQPTQYPLSPIENQSFQHSVSDLSNIKYSAKHTGLYLHVARLLRPVWKKRCIDGQFNSTITQYDCSLVLEDLYAIKNFLDAHSVHDISGGIRSTVGNQNTMINSFSQCNQGLNVFEFRNPNEQAQAEEKRSLTALNFLIKQTCEVIALWKVLTEHQLHLLVKKLTVEQQTILLACTFRDLTLSRADICAFLIVALINSYLNDNATVASISAKLRDVCPNLYRHEDAVSHKATEILILSKNCTVSEEKDEKLRTALRLCKDAAPNLPLSYICQQFTASEFYQGVIELTSTCAVKLDPKEAALHYYINNEPNEDQEGYCAFSARMNCFKEVKQMLDIVYQNMHQNLTKSEYSNLTICKTADNNINTKIMQIVVIAMQTNDPLLHVVVYDWLLSHNMLSELLSITEPSLGEFFRRSVVRNPENLKLTDLLWKYYEKIGQHSAAANILDSLASMQSNAIPLTQRIEYLARAVMCLRNDTVGFSSHNGVLLKDLEDKLEIARVQKVTMDAISALPENSAVHDAISNLNFNLYSMTELYSDFADVFELWECKLTILNCSHHNDPLLIESVWTQIINNEVDAPGTVQDKCTRLLTKVQTLVKEFGDSGHCFPLAFLVRELEIKCCQLRLSESTIPDALFGMKLDIELLIDYYTRMIFMNERVWANEGNEWHLVQSCARLISILINSASQIPVRNRRRAIAKAQELVSACLNLLYPKPGTENLIQNFKEIQTKLQRIS